MKSKKTVNEHQINNLFLLIVLFLYISLFFPFTAEGNILTIGNEYCDGPGLAINTPVAAARTGHLGIIPTFLPGSAINTPAAARTGHLDKGLAFLPAADWDTLGDMVVDIIQALFIPNSLIFRMRVHKGQ